MRRRDFLKAALVGGSSATLLSTLGAHRDLGQILVKPVEAASQSPRTLRVVSRSLDINRHAARVFGLVDAEGRPGLTFTEGQAFRVTLANELSEPTLVHWHGLRPPYEQDGVPDMPAPMLKAGETRDYDFPVGPSGTHWMHAHTLQEQNLLAAPLIVRSAQQDARDEQEVVVLLHDFSFTPAEELLARLKRSTGHGMHSGHMGAMDVNDIDYDAYLANDRTLDDPESSGLKPEDASA
jgi:FtsP/CotA-like multicopper oxidase with cupredoxin domain